MINGKTDCRQAGCSYQDPEPACPVHDKGNAIGQTIWQQMALSTKMMIAAREPVATHDGLMFRVTLRLGQYHKVLVTLNSQDLYDLRLIKITRGVDVVEVGEVADVYAEGLNDAILDLVPA